MDGYAVTSAITQTASPTTPLTLTVLGCIAAGDSPLSAEEVAQQTEAAGAGQHVCYEIMTGAPFPHTPHASFDACIRIEDTTSNTSPTTSTTTTTHYHNHHHQTSPPLHSSPHSR